MKFYKPKKLREANIQAELYRQLTNIGIKCYLEYPIYKEGCGKLRIDCVVLDNKENEILAAIEVRSYKDIYVKVNKKTKRMMRYNIFFDNVKIFSIHNEKTIFELIDWLNESYPRGILK